MLPVSASRSGGGVRGAQRGVALIITVIMLSVITFLAVAFLALSGREKGSVKTTTDQTTSREAANAALARAESDLLAGILASGSTENYGLMVSTNYENRLGYNSGVQTIGIPNLTNVNYRDGAGVWLTGNAALQNLANLYYDPRPPVFITNRAAANSEEFRYYLDLNRNGRADLTGYWGMTNNLNQPLLDNSNRFVTNYVVGDPEWIGGLARPELPHSSSNQFTYRYAYAAVPVGKTLDANYIHNMARTISSSTTDGFSRNQGVGTWEINLAAFFADLNTNLWNPNPLLPTYNYLQPVGFGNTGVAFDDARSFLSYRYAGNYNNLASVAGLYPVAAPIFRTDNIDEYSDFPLLQGPTNVDESAAIRQDNPSLPWSGADNPNHYFSSQDFFDPAKTSTFFTNRLYAASTNVSTYNQSTFYRLLAQLGTDSAPDDSDKLNLNYKNVGGVSATNFVRWTPLDFFTNAASRMLARYSQNWLDTDATYYTNFFGTNQAFSLTTIPVVVSNRFVYAPSVHRLLQLAANLADTKTTNLWPSVFRPIFRRDNLGIYITGYEQAPTNNVDNYLIPAPIEVADVPMGTDLRVNVYGVPWVVGAKTGLPNFNEISMHSLFEVTRKMQITRPSLGAPASQWRTNIMYVAGVSNAIGVEAWNSYHNDFTNPVLIRVSGYVRMALTNEFGVPLSSSGPLTNDFIPIVGISNVTVWPGMSSWPNPKSFVIPVLTNISFLPESVYRLSSRTFSTNLNLPFEVGQGYPQPKWGMIASARLRFVMQLTDAAGNANGPILDYVQLDDLGGARNLSEEIRDPDGTLGFEGLWATNLVRNGQLPQGILNQIDISLGNNGANTADWKSYDRQTHPTKDLEIDYFRAFCGVSPLQYNGLVSTSLVQQVPFTPTRRVLQQWSWQANDPLVHYTAGDLLDLARTNNVERPTLAQPLKLLDNIRVVNHRYSPWSGSPMRSGTDPNSFNVAVKDPGIRFSDNWQFPTNNLPGVGWLGRVHRGTPWQTVYLKASDLNIGPGGSLPGLSFWLTSPSTPAPGWMVWSGNPDPTNSFFTRPVTDRLLFDIFTTAINDNAARGQLSVNQTNLAAWSAVFSGVVALTNSFAARSAPPKFEPVIIQPAGIYDTYSPATWPPLVKLVAGINAERSRALTNGAVISYTHPGGWFQSAGDLLSVPELTDASPFRNADTNSLSFQNGVNDVVYEWLPQQIMSLVHLDDPRFVIYAYGQALRPAENSIITSSGAFFGLCTNYQITAEVAARAVVRVEGSANPKDANNANPKRRYPPRLKVESYNYLPPD